MALRSKLFRGDPVFENCATQDAAHIVPGAVGAHVSKIQTALFMVDKLQVAAPELASRRYGSSTAQAVLAYKRKRNIVNRAYQTQADDIVGKMTITTLDADVQRAENTPQLADASTFAWTTRRV